MTTFIERCGVRAFGFGGLWRTIACGTAWVAVGNLTSQLSSLVAGVLVARMLGKESYGKFGLLQTSIAVWTLISGFGMSLTVTRYLSRYRINEPKEAGNVIGSTTIISIALAAVVSLVVLFAARSISNSISQHADLTVQLRISAIVMLVLSLLGVQQGILTGFESFRGAGIVNVLRAIFLAPLTLLGIRYGQISGALWAMAVAAVLALVGGIILIHQECVRFGIKPQWRVRTKDWRMIGDCALPAFGAGVVVTPVNWIVSASLVRSPGGYSQLAVLTVCIYYRTAMLFFQSISGTVLLPILSSASKKQRDGVLWSAVRLNGCLALCGVALAEFSTNGLLSLFGSGFAGNGRVAMANAASGGLMLASGPLVIGS
jgi:O-antigen/teichoic acid export membrane protein